jgi:hypothetical protein
MAGKAPVPGDFKVLAKFMLGALAESKKIMKNENRVKY